MKISNRVKHNISFILTIVGIACIAARTGDVIADPNSDRAWFKLVSIVVLTYFCFNSFRIYRARLKNGIIFD